MSQDAQQPEQPKHLYEVDYSNEVAVTVHAAGCAHRPQNGRSRQPLKSMDLKTALIEAQYQGQLEPSDSWDLGYTKAAPCAKRVAAS